jgi:glycosyltransferase involved in cell wall biosynthesis
VGILWAQYGPYHFARVSALKKAAGATNVHAMELASESSDYAWNRSQEANGIITLCPGSVAEQLPFRQVFQRARKEFKKLKLDVCILPSYAPKQSLAVLLAAKSLRIPTVMMNESHAGTARARGLGAVVKRRLVALFDSALVGGNPHRRFFDSLGLPREKIFTGYDAIDNDYFSTRAKEVRERAGEFRARFDLPEHYFLSLGRFVAKKNLATLIRAYRMFLNTNPESRTHLVMVGSGEEESALRKLCGELRLPVYEKAGVGKGDKGATRMQGPAGVHLYGFRQIEDNPVFYALADCFVLPSSWEEWGLVVNEAMASGLPVVVSEAAGCAEDLLANEPLPSPVGLSETLRECLAYLAGRIRQNGFVFNPRSPRMLANAFVLLESSPELRQKMGEASRSIVEKFSCENFARNALAAARAAAGIGNVPIVTKDEALVVSEVNS